MIWILVFTLLGFAEEEPAAEYPYPQRTLAEDTLNLEQPVRKGKRGEYYYDTSQEKKKKQPYQGIEKPYRVGSDGTYYYDTGDTKKDDDINAYDGVEKPIDRDSRGGYYYKRKKKNRESRARYGPKPAKIETDGTYVYDVDPGKTRNIFYLRGGALGSPKITASSGATFDDVYGSSSNFVLALEYDWLIAENLFLKLGSGFTTTEGKGQFENGRPTIETFQFYIFPNTLTLSYKLQIADIQYLTPYVEAGPGYFSFIEHRSDGDFFAFKGETTKFGGAFVGTATAGLLISLSKFSNGTSLMTDYGATQSWIDIQYKQVFGLDDRKDFSSNMITGGFAIGF